MVSFDGPTEVGPFPDFPISRNRVHDDSSGVAGEGARATDVKVEGKNLDRRSLGVATSNVAFARILNGKDELPLRLSFEIEAQSPLSMTELGQT